MMTQANAGHPVGIVGAGLIGLAVARQLAQSHVPVLVFEKEATVARHQSGHNSGVVHAGIYYLPGSAKATLCRRGVNLLSAYCADRGLPWDARGKLVVARDEAETAKLREIERRAAADGDPGVRWLDAAEIRELEPEITGEAALLSPTTAIVDYPAIARSFADDVTELAGRVLTGTPVTGVQLVMAVYVPLLRSFVYAVRVNVNAATSPSCRIPNGSWVLASSPRSANRLAFDHALSNRN